MREARGGVRRRLRLVRRTLLRTLRKWRKRAWDFQIKAGNYIALLKGPRAYVKRLLRKRVHKLAGKGAAKVRPKL